MAIVTKQTTNGLKAWKDFHDLSVLEISEAAHASRPTVYAWLNGTSGPSIDQARMLEAYKPGLMRQLGFEVAT